MPQDIQFSMYAELYDKAISVMEKPDYHWIKFDETKHWNKEFLTWVGPDTKIIATYVFDHNRAVNCSELTPSYELHWVGTVAKTSRELTDGEREEIEEKVTCSELDRDGISYHHCRGIDNSKTNPSRPIRQFVDCDEDTKIEEVIEYYQGNPW